jgi:asparagine synthase (glutamine-hydrolysing)
LDLALLEAMNAVQAHRGPDDVGVWFDARAGVGLCHRRLSIIDLSPAGRQPMHDMTGRAVITYNGEIYNYLTLKKELEQAGYLFRSSSDTEVILNLYLSEGIAFLEQLNGIFSLALWDVNERLLLLARDPMGVKPLYYTELSDAVLFASEIKAILRCPKVPRTLDVDALRAYLTFLWAPGTNTILKAVRKVLPGEALLVKEGRIIRKWRYARPHFREPIQNLSAKETTAELRHLLREAVQRQMISDVPVGAFLSGGLDSSTVVYFAREWAQSGQLDCFTIACDGGLLDSEGLVDDYPYAERVAQALGVKLHTIRVGHEMADRVAEMVWHLDEPQPDPACLNVLLISELARREGIPVLLSGAGGDDLFTGYRRHVAHTFEPYWTWLPRPIIDLMARGTQRLNHGRTVFRRLSKLLAHANGDETASLIGYFYWADPLVVDNLFTKEAQEGFSLSHVSAMLQRTLLELPRETPSLNQMLYLELRHFLADHNLNYTDKMSMARGVEVRVPLLDPDIVSFAAKLPLRQKQRGRVGKWVLREAMRGLLPDEVLNRPKTGFAAPLRRWVRKDLRPLIEDVLGEPSIRQRGLFEPAAVKGLISADREGRIDAAYTIFGLFCIELWCRLFLDGKGFSNVPGRNGDERHPGFNGAALPSWQSSMRGL